MSWKKSWSNQASQATYRDDDERLAAVEQQYDPDNLFHVNQNTRPDGRG